MRKHGEADPLSFLLLSWLLILPLVSSFSGSHGHMPRLRRLVQEDQDADESSFPNSRLRDAYIALQAWKLAIVSDPMNLTGNWVGPAVCNYTGVFCSPLPSDPTLTVVAGVDLNHGDLAGYLPHQLGLLADLALIHINSNRFCGTLPRSLRRLALLHELDVSNNRLAGPFPDVVLRLPSLRYLDLRINEFEGAVPPELFDRDLDAILLNHNRFAFDIPDNLGNSPVSVVSFLSHHPVDCSAFTCKPFVPALPPPPQPSPPPSSPPPPSPPRFAFDIPDNLGNSPVSVVSANVSRSCLIIPSTALLLPASPSCRPSLLRRSRHLLHLLRHRRRLIPSLRYLDLRINEFEGAVPPELRSCLIIPSTALLLPASPSCRPSLLRRSRHLLHLLRHRRRLLHSLRHLHLLRRRRLIHRPLLFSSSTVPFSSSTVASPSIPSTSVAASTFSTTAAVLYPISITTAASLLRTISVASRLLQSVSTAT
ncbi:hypothetical protein C4D60_Mb03t15940 [Musa balbisiana]|uniref:Cell wall hydroxyproline-rich glycoprotein n=1 Tax=Musa balbisiana TaxID=52838 RepID=A0A4S8JA62_MUSBA|nr:hypothetical protein C4D60_Mb03t15940 [Musa balbisiana]